MSRWHLDICTKPVVFTNKNSTPHCKTCGASAGQLLEKAKSEQLSSSDLPDIPADEPPGHLGLRWPPNVPFKKARRQSGLPSPTPNTNAIELDKADANVSNSASFDLSPIYGPTLGPDEFRLVCLEAVSDSSQNSSSQLVHLSLETFTHNRCPEYETVSYTWAGEDGNSSLICPVYIGPYWDILFSTNNCWSMLQYLRPWRGVRMVWIDAVCINQHNTSEKVAQVAKMGKIYTECSRAVLWLGNDVVRPSEVHQSRHPLYDLQSTLVTPRNKDRDQPQVHLGHLLARRYFKRVWVIQELILSRRVIIPIGDKILWADSALMENWSTRGPSDWRWEKTNAPWVENITRGEFPAENAFKLIAGTSTSQASDPRDRIFGVLGLLKDESTKGQLLPDYTLSIQQIFLGFFAYSILNLSHHELLFHSRGCTTDDATLTWMPNWESQAAWESIFNTQLDDRQNWETFVPWVVKDQTETRLAASISPGTHPYIKLMKFTSNTKQPPFLKKGYSFFSFDKRHQTIQESRPWKQNASINSDTGALSINLTKLVTITSRAQLIDRDEKLGLYEIPLDRRRARWLWKSHQYLDSPHSAIYMVSRLPLDTLIKPNLDEIFVFQPGKSKSLVYLVLRKSEQKWSFRLVACCANVCFGMATATRVDATTYPLEALQHDLYRDLKDVARYFNSPIDRADYYHFLTTELVTHLDFLPFYLDHARENIDGDKISREQDFPVPEPFGQRFIKGIDPIYVPTIQSKFVHLQFEPEYWDSHMVQLLQTRADTDWSWSKDGRSWKGMHDFPVLRSGFLARKLPRPIYLRCPIQKIHQRFFSIMPARIWYQLEALYRSGKIGVSDAEVEARIRTGPREEERYIATPFHDLKTFSADHDDIMKRYSEDAYLPNQLGVDGSTHLVQIL